MAEYKRKKRSAFKTAPKINKSRIKGNNIQRDIKMSSDNEPVQRKNMRVVRGKRLETKRKLKVVSIALVIIIAVLLICEWLMPAGIGETLATTFATWGTGAYPAALESSNTINAVSKGSYYYVLTNNNIEAYSGSGKRIFSYSHGFENPVLKTSATRAIVFGQDSNQALIFTLNGLKTTVETKKKIKTAAIGDNGTYAIVTTADSYAAQVSVYQKNEKLVYEWFSSKDLVNNVAVAPSGEKIAVSTISSSVGSYNSKLLVFEVDSSKSEYEKTYENTVIYSLDTAFTGGFSVLTANEYDYIKWSNYKVKNYKNEYNTAMFRTGNNGMAVVYNRENDKTDNRIAVFSKSGELKRELQFKGIITDFAFKDGHVYCMSDTKAYILDDDGSVMRSADCGFGAVKICPISQSEIAVVTDNAISEIKLEQE